MASRILQGAFVGLLWGLQDGIQAILGADVLWAVFGGLQALAGFTIKRCFLVPAELAAVLGILLFRGQDSSQFSKVGM